MHRVGEEVHIDCDDVRSSETPRIVRCVLLISIVLAILALSATWITGALAQKPAQGWPVTAKQNSLGG